MKHLKLYFFSLLALLPFLASCTTADTTPEKKWKVKVSKAGEAKVWVFRPDGSKQCGMAPAQLSPEQAAERLRTAGVMVHQFRLGNDGMMRTAVCGSDTGDTVEVEISKMDLPKAQARGFQPMKTQAQN